MRTIINWGSPVVDWPEGLGAGDAVSTAAGVKAGDLVVIGISAGSGDGVGAAVVGVAVVGAAVTVSIAVGVKVDA